MTDRTSTSRELLKDARQELALVAEANRFVPLVTEGRAPREALRMLACEEMAIVPSDRRSFALLGARFSESPAGEFFLGLAEAERRALGHLHDLARALGLDESAIAAYRPQPGCQAYPSYIAWLALNGSRSDVALALVANLADWGGFCAATAAGLRAHYGLDDEAVGFFDFFATPPPTSTSRRSPSSKLAFEPGTFPRTLVMLPACSRHTS